ncbi:MAG: hypothetical protein Q4D31_04475 [Eubacteriales bacterium]|nr:hypothetical protein [Eubacteriales bacterium]
MKKDDYGYFGKGLDGYAHYKQAFDQTHRSDAPSSGRRRSRSGEMSSEQLQLIAVVLLSMVVLAILLTAFR